MPNEWEGVPILHWGGEVCADYDKGIEKLYNTCTIDNLWICRCWYLSNPCTLNYVQNSPTEVHNDFYDVLSLRQSGSYEDAKSFSGNTINSYGVDINISSLPL